MRPLRLGILLLVMAVACRSAPTTVLLRIEPGEGLPVLDHLTLDIFSDTGREVQSRRLPETGAPALPGDVVLYPSQKNGTLRLLVRARGGGSDVLGEGTTRVELRPGEQVETTVVIKATLLPDGDHDGVPDVIDNCPAEPNPEQGPCGAGDGGTDGPATDGPTGDGPATDGPTGDGPATDGPAGDGPPPPPPPSLVASTDGWGLRNPSFPDLDLHAVWGSAKDNVWAVGDNGAALRYDGARWILHDTGSTERLRGVWSPSPTQAWAVGDNGVILHYDGAQWTQSSPGLGKDLYGVWGSSPSDIWAVGQKVILHHNGVTWSLWSGSNYYVDLFDVQGLGAGAAWAVGKRGGPSDGIIEYAGTTWQPIDLLGEEHDLHAVWPASSTEVWCVGHGGAVMGYDGTGWTTAITPANDDLHDVWADGSGQVWAVGQQGTILHRGAAGGWSIASSGTQNRLRGIWGSSASDIWIVGEAGTLLHYDGSSWSPPPAPMTSSTLRGAWRSPGGDLWVVGSSGTILRHSSGSWSKVSSGVTTTLNAVWGATATDIWAVGQGGLALHHTGGGWTQVSSGTGNDLHGVWGAGPADVWAVGGKCIYDPTYGTTTCSGRVTHYDGTGWDDQSLGSKVLRGVWGAGPADVWAVGDGGRVYRHNGSQWSKAVSTPTSNNLNGIWGSGPQDIWIVGHNGAVLHHDGTNLSAVGSGTGEDLLAVSGTGSLVWAVGTDGTVLRHGATGWTSQLSGGDWFTLRAVLAIAADDVWALGTDGVMLHYDDSWP